MNLQVREAHLAHGIVRYVEEGSGPALVLVHGLGGNWQNWLANVAPLAQRHRVVAMDLPGFGASDGFVGRVTMQRYADVLIELLDELGIEKATFAGNSMGGLLTIEAAARYPHRVSAAVLAGSGGVPLDTLGHRLFKVPLSKVVNRALRHTAVRRRLLARPSTRKALASGIVHDVSNVDAHTLIEALDGLGTIGFGPALRAGRGYDARRRAPGMSCRTLIVWGRQDRLLPLWMAHELHRAIESSELIVWDDTGHCPMLEQPARFNELVTTFVAGIGRSAGKGLPSGE